MNTKIKNSIIKNAVRYYADGVFSFSDGKIIPAEKNAAVKILILARRHYIERSITLPITIKKDVKAAVEFDIESLKTEFKILYRISKPENGKTQVMIWQIPKSLGFGSGLFLVPETYLLAGELQSNHVLKYLSANSSNVLLARDNEQLRSSKNSHLDVSVFSQMIGITNPKVLDITQSEFVTRVLFGLQQHVLELFPTFWVKKDRKSIDWHSRLKPYLFPVAFFTIGYLVISSAWVSLQYQSVQAQVNEQRSKINAVLDTQTKIKQLEGELESLASHSEQQPPLWKVWKILSPFYQQGCTFKFIRYSEGQVYIGGTAPSASTVLEMLLDDPLVQSPEFTTSVKKLETGDQFIVRFGFAPTVESGNQLDRDSSKSEVSNAE